MPTKLQLGPNPTAVEKFTARTPVVSPMRTADWAQVPLQMRERAFFSAGVQDARVIGEMKQLIASELAMKKDAAGAYESRDRFIAQMKDLLEARGYPMGGNGLTDITSYKRLALIHRMGVEESQSFARWRAGQDGDYLDAWPAQELLRLEDRAVPRDWEGIWASHGGQFFGSNRRMIALKDDPIWTAISRFGKPWPPFDFGSGMGVEDVSREEAVAFGLIAADDPVDAPAVIPPAEYDISQIDPDALRRLTEQFPAAVVKDGRIFEYKA